MLHSTGDLENTLNKKSQTETVTYFNYLTYMNCQEKVYLKKKPETRLQQTDSMQGVRGDTRASGRVPASVGTSF